MSAVTSMTAAVHPHSLVSLEDSIRRELSDSAETQRRVAEVLAPQIARAAAILVEALQSANGQVLFFGNGGSASDAQHLAAELVGRFRRDRAPLRALALTANVPVLTSVANDYEYAEIFARQVQAFARPGDVVVGISTSGNSPNVVRGLLAARERGAFTVALTGEGGGACALHADLVLAVPSKITARIQESHIAIGHVLCGIVEERVFASCGGAR